MGGIKLAALLLLSLVLTSHRVCGQEDITPKNEDETDFDTFGTEQNAFPPEDSFDDQLDIQCPPVCECSQDQKADGLKITVDCSAKGLDKLPEINEFDSKTNILLLNGNQLDYLDSAISGLKELEELNLDDNVLVNIATGSISELPKLQRLSLANNKLDAFPQDLQMAKSLTTVDLSGNYFSEPVTGEDFTLLGEIESIVLPNAASSLIIELCEHHVTLKQVCTESCDTDVNECAKAEDVADPIDDAQESISDDPSEVSSNDSSLYETSAREELSPAEEQPEEDISIRNYITEEESSAKLNPVTAQTAETTSVDTFDENTPVTDKYSTEIPAPDESKNLDTPEPVEETFGQEVPIEENAAEDKPVEDIFIETAAIEETPAEEVALVGTLTDDKIVTSVEEQFDETDQNEKTLTEYTFVEPLADGTTITTTSSNQIFGEEVTIEGNAGEDEPVGDISVETAAMEATQAEESAFEGNLTEKGIVTPVEEQLVETDQNEQTTTEDHTFVEPLTDETPITTTTVQYTADDTEYERKLDDETYDIKSPITETPNGEIEYGETPTEEAPVNDEDSSQLSTESSPILAGASISEETPELTISSMENIASGINSEVIMTSTEPTNVEESSVALEDISTVTPLARDDAIDASIVFGSFTEPPPVDNAQTEETLVDEGTIESKKEGIDIPNAFSSQPAEHEPNRDSEAETADVKSKNDEGFLLKLPINDEDTNNVTTHVSETVVPIVLGSRILSDSEQTDDLSASTTESNTANMVANNTAVIGENQTDETAAAVNVNKGSVDNTIIALVIACMVCVVAGVTIRKNWSTIQKKIRPRSRAPIPDMTKNGMTPEEVPLKDNSPA